MTGRAAPKPTCSNGAVELHPRPRHPAFRKPPEAPRCYCDGVLQREATLAASSPTSQMETRHGEFSGLQSPEGRRQRPALLDSV
jgi:hypothetical protein